jgi:hypothetical protein
LLIDFNGKQWAAVQHEKLLAALAWTPQGGRSETLYAATGPESAPEALTLLLVHARRMTTYYSQLTLDYPADEMPEAIRAAGFKPRRTLLWMRA